MLDVDRDAVALDLTAGFERVVEVGLAVSPTAASTGVAAAAIAAAIDGPVPVRIVGVGTGASRVIVTLAITLGTVEEIAQGTGQAAVATAFLQELVRRLEPYDPAFVPLPDPASIDARIAAHVQADPSTLAPALRRLADGV